METMPIPFRITVCGLDELIDHAAAGPTHVLSILDPGWPAPEILRDFAVHRCLRLHFHDVIEPSPAWSAPESWDVDLLLAFGRDVAATAGASGGVPATAGAGGGVHLLAHCHAGISRSTAAAILLLAQYRADRPAEEAVAEVARVRPRAWPNLRLLELGDAALGRGGEIVSAACTQYRRVLAREPQLADAMIGGGRGREVAVALSRS